MCVAPVSPTSTILCVHHAEVVAARRAGRPVMTFNARVVQLEKQNHRCPICDEALDIYTAHVDHNHFSGTNRGLTHAMCNLRTVDLVENHFDDIARAVRYLEEH
jgi:hypothetical protein